MADLKYEQEEVLSFLRKSPILIAVFGEFSCGKSTFINALIGEDILSVAVDPTTAVPVYIKYGREFNIFVNLTNDDELKLFEDEPPFWARFVGRASVLNTLKKQQDQIKDFLRQWTTENQRADKVDHISIELPLDWLRTGIELVDTPGTNVEFTKHQHYTEVVSMETDISIMLMDARHGGGKRTEFNFMNSVQEQVLKSFVVLNKMDLLDKEERKDIVDFVKNEALPKHWNGAVPPEVFGLSAKVRLEPELAKREKKLLTQFGKFMKEVEEIIQKERGKILLHRLGNPDKILFNDAKRLEKKSQYDKAHQIYFDLLDILTTAGMNTKPALEGIQRSEENLAEQVNSLDVINGEINQAAKLEEDDPDSALTILKKAHKELLALRLKSEAEEIVPKIGSLSKRIIIRDSARRSIEQIQEEAQEYFEKKDFIRSAEEIRKIYKHFTNADLSPPEQTKIKDTITFYTKERDKWAGKEWKAVTNKAKNYLDKHEYEYASKLIYDLEKIKPFVSDLVSANEFIQDVKKSFAEFQKYVLLSNNLENRLIPVLKRVKVTWDEVSEFYPDLKRLKIRHNALFSEDRKIDLPHVRGNQSNLLIDEKTMIAEYFKEHTCKYKEATYLLKSLRERKVELDDVDFSGAWKEIVQLYKRYPDHPDLYRLITRKFKKTVTKARRGFSKGGKINRLLSISKLQTEVGAYESADETLNVALGICRRMSVYKKADWLTIIFSSYSSVGKNEIVSRILQDTRYRMKKLESRLQWYRSYEGKQAWASLVVAIVVYFIIWSLQLNMPDIVGVFFFLFGLYVLWFVFWIIVIVLVESLVEMDTIRLRRIRELESVLKTRAR